MGSPQKLIWCHVRTFAEHLLESKGMYVVFQKKGKKTSKSAKKGKIFEKLGKNIQNLKYFEKVQKIILIFSMA